MKTRAKEESRASRLEFRIRNYFVSRLKSQTSSLISERGDTLIEVTLATVIISTILFSAYTLSSQAFKLGRVGAERTQAAQLLQTQIEGLRALRDSADSWDQFHDNILNPTILGGGFFHVDVDPATSRWRIAEQTDCTTNWNPKSDPLADSSLPDFYRLCVQVTDSSKLDHLKFRADISWERFGGGDIETASLFYNLTNRNITFGGM